MSYKITGSTITALLILGLGIGFLNSPAFAYDVNSTSAVNVDAQGVAMHGYDPVAYFTTHAPAKGLAKFSAKHDGMIFHFASAANRDLFKANPARYEPQFGGFCTMGVALEKKFDGDPEAWLIADDGKLYLNVNKDVQKKYMEDVNGNNEAAYKNWSELKDKTPKSING